MTTIAAGQQQTLTIQEGQALNIIGGAGAAGVAYLLDPVLGGANSTKSWTVGAGALAAIGPFAGQRRVLIVCITGSISVELVDATINSPLIIVSSAAPSNADGRPDGTVYIQTA